MNYATRINSFLRDPAQTVVKAVETISRIKGISHIELNYPEHFNGNSPLKIKSLLDTYGLRASGIALRFRDIFCNGEFTNADDELVKQATTLCLKGIEACRAIGGQVVTIWQAFDGYDYPFQSNYAHAWQQMKEAFRLIADAAAPDIRVSIEYKPFQPRAFSLMPNMASALLMIEDVKRENLGVTLDFCHMLMAGENPACSLDLVASRGKLYGIHLNDGYRMNDDGLMVGSVHLMQTIEFLYYTKKHHYTDVIYFDTFPVRENTITETERNLLITEKIFKIIEKIGDTEIESMISCQDGMTAIDILRKYLVNDCN
jgi:xylose isomerase